METITVSVDEETYRRLCAKAAEEGTDIAALVRAYLCEYAETEEERSMRLRRLRREVLASIHARERSRDPAVHLTRDELHDRDALR